MISGRSRRRLIQLAAASLLFLAPLHRAEAHAILVESTPAAKGSIAGPSITLTLRYNSRIDKARSKLTLTRPDSRTETLAIDQDGAEDVLVAHAEAAPGAYSVRWQVLAIDGHITRGDVPFTVTGSGAP